jgi:1-acyl-sn-glycerol-3-phosphate acyltransferase
VRGSPVLFLANHQVLLEPCVFSVLSPLITGTPIVALAKAQQRESLLVQTVLAACSAFAGMPEVPIVYFDRSNPGSLLDIVRYLRKMMMEERRSVLIHVEGVRGLTCRTPVKAASGVLLDLAVEANVPILPVRFTGGLPVAPLTASLDFPIGYGKQQYILGPPIRPEELARLSLLDKKARVLSAINGLGPSSENEMPSPPNPEFQRRVARRMEKTGVSETEAVLLECAGLPYGSSISELLTGSKNTKPA